MELHELTPEHFEAAVGETFTVNLGPEHSFPLVLATVERLAVHPGREGRTKRTQPFTLMFRGPGHFYVEQRIYQLEHERLGTIELFLVPIGPDQEGMRYEAIFN
jgi:hypothetical protein